MNPTFKKDFASNVFFATQGFAEGLEDDYGDIITAGTYFYVQMTALQDLTLEDLKDI